MAATRPDDRLTTAAAFVRQGAVFADIGTDHAYLPLFLLETGRITAAVASDIHLHPLEIARKNACAAGVSERIDFRLADGLTGMAGLGLTDIAVCGMGGEQIAHVIDRAPFVRAPGIRLILQPMSRAAYLRRYLAENGFTVEAETIAVAAGRLYACLCVSYTGIRNETMTDAEALCGRSLLRRAPTARERAYVCAARDTAAKRCAGLRAGADAETSDASDIARATALLRDLDAYLSQYPAEFPETKDRKEINAFAQAGAETEI